MSGMKGLDAWITGGRFHRDAILVHCPNCEEYTPNVAETEYGQTYWTVTECSYCGREFDGDEPYEEDPRDDG